jgi:hypothetical protein
MARILKCGIGAEVRLAFRALGDWRVRPGYVS